MEREIDIATQVRLLARVLDEQAETLDAVIVIGVQHGELKHAWTSASEDERAAMLDSARASLV
jgi:hypothetical protein